MADLFLDMKYIAVDFWEVWDSIMLRSVVHVSILLLISMLVLKELLIAMGGKWRSFVRYLNIPIVLLLIVVAVELVHQVSMMVGNGG